MNRRDASRAIRRVTGIALAGLMLALPDPAELGAQIADEPDLETTRQTRIGAQASYGLGTSETIRNADLGIGGRAEIPFTLSDTPLKAIGSVDLFFPGDDITYWEINANLGYRFPVSRPREVRPYLGGGLVVANASNGSSESEIGLNLLGGVEIPTERVAPFVEARLELQGGEQLVLTGGVLF